MSSPPEGIVDGHVHFWQRAEVDHPWLTADAGVIDADFVPSDLHPHLAAAGVGRVVVVQSADSVEENRYLLDLAASTPWIAAVVGWAPLLDPRGCEELVSGLVRESRFVGVRHLVHTEVDQEWLARPEVTASLRILAAAGLVFEIPAEFPLHLDHVPALAQAVPTLRIVVDHLGKPPVASGEVAPWRAAIERVADFPNVFSKVSGLNTVAAPGRWTADHLRPYVDVAIELFGAERLLFGSDWPVLLLDGSYESVIDATRLALGGLDADELDRVMRGTACELYQLDDRAEGSRTGGSAP
jgi:L-fuconolactonase